MRRIEVRRTCTLFRVAVEAVKYQRQPGPEQALADLDANLAAYREQGDWQVTGSDVPTSFVINAVSLMRQWSGAPGWRREALTGCVLGVVDTLAKWIDGELAGLDTTATPYWQVG